jgi:hypothetical protein
VVTDTWVDLVALECTARAEDSISPSDEHSTVVFLDLATLSDDELPPVYKRLSARQ